jgi:hypothetical protein
MARDIVFSITVDHVGFVVNNVALGQVNFALQYHCAVAYGP